MARAYVLIITEVGSENEVFEKMGKIKEVKESYEVYGVYDILARIETETMEELKNTIGYEIRGKIEGVRSTITLIVV
ncbi:MAG: Lrp/AsnC ligand binding domain-containing protein [Promethearchaeota archaeon]|jgi:DNA-binding Lrp family transcriptional regulator